MDREEVLAACAARPAAVEDYPFGDGVAVFKVSGKMFALVSLADEPGDLSVKCDPELAIALRSQYEAVRPGYHLNKRHWNTVTLDNSVPDDELTAMIEDSYALVVERLPRTDRDRLSAGAG